ncbi:hypothetical protein PhCBS80983_g01808 [Powellomyces hirtus]|uniref:Uncharacterized protein n=1 Tax=Powellomyces hirtus TaxID=109895 RepID=A0A507E8K4_9FUNG|nr:hypothetical protein PhCBS80983_g01808 [Powellomyces hirtus]
MVTWSTRTLDKAAASGRLYTASCGTRSGLRREGRRYITDTRPEILNFRQSNTASEEDISEADKPADLERKGKVVEELLEDYPLELTGWTRRGPFDPIPSWWPWIERTFLGPARRSVARMTAWGWMEARFEHLEPSGSTEKYFPTTFASGTRGAFSAMISRLSKWDGTAKNDNGLREMLDDELYARFCDQHSWMEENGISIEIIEDETQSTDDVHVGDVWLTFGKSTDVEGTLMLGKVVRRFNPLGFVRKLENDNFLYREVTFEYVIPQNEVEKPSPGSASLTFGQRADKMKQGQVVGVDVSLPIRLSVRFLDRQTGDLIRSVPVEHDVQLRFETPHFTRRPFENEDEGQWYIADIDCLRQQERIEEEEECLELVPDQ